MKYLQKRVHLRDTMDIQYASDFFNLLAFSALCSSSKGGISLFSSVSYNVNEGAISQENHMCMYGVLDAMSIKLIPKSRCMMHINAGLSK